MLRLDASGSLVLERRRQNHRPDSGARSVGHSRGMSPIESVESPLADPTLSIVAVRVCHRRLSQSARPTPALGIYSVHRNLGNRIYRGSMSTIVAVHGQYRPPPKLVPCRSSPTAGHRKVRSCSPRMRHPRDASSNPCWPACQGQFGQWGYARSPQPARHAPRR
jgi:hypothetical protein